MSTLYNFFIAFYRIAAHVASLFNTKAKQFVTGRKHWKTELTKKRLANESYIWFHCASLGEFEQGRPLIEELKMRHPEYKIALTFFSPSGFEIRKNYPGADMIMYLPMDTSGNAKTFLELLKPAKAIFVKYEYWYNYLTLLKQKGIPTYIVSAIFRPEQAFFKKNMAGNWYRGILKCFSHIYVQNSESALLLEGIGIKNVTISGDTRFDRVFAIASSARKLTQVQNFKGTSKTIIAGSTWAPDEELLARFIHKHPEIKIIIAPHEVTERNINRIETLFKTSSVRNSKALSEDMNHYQVLIIDSIGLLSSLYQYGDVAYIGGGFGVGIHNILEAATFGLPVLFGPNYHKFKEANDLISMGGAYSVRDYNDMETTLNNLLIDDNRRLKAASKSKKYVLENTGSTNIILGSIFG